jgi:hypothetical protein
MGNSIGLQTSQRKDIKNSQEFVDRNLPLNRFQLTSIKEQFVGLKFKDNPSDIYNCHGLTFASRRTGIYEVAEITKIINDDKYEEIHHLEDLLPGDIVLYFGENGDIEHSGIVLDIANQSIKIPLILSKWGMLYEVIHSVYICPYNKEKIKYYRCKL